MTKQRPIWEDFDHRQQAALAGFLGYGDLETVRICFVGLEEGLGGRTTGNDPHDNLIARTNWNPVMDRDVAHGTLVENGRPQNDHNRSGSSAVWLWMARIALAAEGQPYRRASVSEAKEYMFNRLGRTGDWTFLTELWPIPQAETNEWKRERRAMLKPAAATALEDRKRTLVDLVNRSNVLTVCYGYGNRDAFASELNLKWDDRRSTTIIDKPFCVSTSGTALVIPFLGRDGNRRPMCHDFLEPFTEHPLFVSALKQAGLRP